MKNLSDSQRFDEFYKRVCRLVAGCLRDTQNVHGEPLPGSVAKRVACNLWAELQPGSSLAELLPREG